MGEVIRNDRFRRLTERERVRLERERNRFRKRFTHRAPWQMEGRKPRWEAKTMEGITPEPRRRRR